MGELMTCRICGHKTIEYLNLGNHPPSDNFLTKEQLGLAGEKVHPLILVYCPNCSLSQLSHVVPCNELYTDEYPYETGLNDWGVDHFRLMAWSIGAEFQPEYVVDIGSNDGTLLSNFNCEVCGIDPVPLKSKVYTINKFFGLDSVGDALEYGGEADVVTATNVFAHIDDLHGFMENIQYLLAEDGVFIIEAPYIIDMIKGLAFDTVYHEHLSYLSIKPLVHLFKQYDMEIFDVRHYPIHCGTMRYYVARKGMYNIRQSVGEYFCEELEYHDIEILNKFGKRVDTWIYNLFETLIKLNIEGKVVGVSAPAKGNTLLNTLKNYSYTNVKLFEYITEKSERKIGKYTPGTHIEIVPDSRLIEDRPDYALILAHNWAEPITKNLRKMGYKGEIIIPNEKGIKNLHSWTQRPGRIGGCARATA